MGLAWWESIVYVVGAVVFGLLVVVPIVAVIATGSPFRKGKLSVKDEEFRRLVDGATKFQREIKESQEKIMAELIQMNKRIATIETILKEVE